MHRCSHPTRKILACRTIRMWGISTSLKQCVIAPHFSYHLSITKFIIHQNRVPKTTLAPMSTHSLQRFFTSSPSDTGLSNDQNVREFSTFFEVLYFMSSHSKKPMSSSDDFLTCSVICASWSTCWRSMRERKRHRRQAYWYGSIERNSLDSRARECTGKCRGPLSRWTHQTASPSPLRKLPAAMCLAP